jgi:hypothetical protein
MTRETLLGLADRCEQATGPDRELDGAIEVARDPMRETILYNKPGRFPQEAVRGPVKDLQLNARDLAEYITAPAYTASLDSAMTLVPEGFGFKLASVSFEKWAQVVREDKLPDGTAIISGGPSAKAATLPLAMCAAALKARASL